LDAQVAFWKVAALEHTLAQSGKPRRSALQRGISERAMGVRRTLAGLCAVRSVDAMICCCSDSGKRDIPPKRFRLLKASGRLVRLSGGEPASRRTL
jgi:hypothetical protein